ncbi:MAG: lipoprotein [Pseudomonadota bacterium]
MPFQGLAILIACGLTVAACGVRGDLELPPRAVASQAGADAGADAAPEARKPERPFLLDPLL